MENRLINGNALPGVYEIDAQGMVIYSSVKSADGFTNPRHDLNGIDFFREITQFNNANDFQQRFESFREASIPSESFDFTCRYETKRQKIRVLLARFVESPTSCSFLVYIRHTIGDQADL